MRDWNWSGAILSFGRGVTRPRWRLHRPAVVAAAVALAAAVGVAAAQAQSEPPKLKQELAQLDRNMAHVTDQVKARTLSGDALASAISGLEIEKHRLIGNFNQDLFGVPAPQVIFGFIVIDVRLNHAGVDAVNGFPTEAIVDEFEAAKKAKQNLEKKFDDAGKAPDVVFSAFVHLDRDMTRVIDEAKAGTLSGHALDEAIAGLEAKKALLETNFPQNLFGVSAWKVIFGFDQVDVRLTVAIVGAVGDAHTEAIVHNLEAAKEAKQKLEQEFAAAASCSQPKVRGVAATAAACPPPSVTLNCPPTATLGGELAVSGSVTPAAAGESVAVAFTPPSESPFTEPATTNTAGDFTSSTTASTSGTWKTQAFEGSIASPPCYTTVGTAG